MYLQIACCDLTRTAHPCLWLITWEPTQSVATRLLTIQKNGTWYCYGWDLTKNICEVFGQNGYIRSLSPSAKQIAQRLVLGQSLYRKSITLCIRNS
ncbi:MAG: hypothetical protein Q4C05_08835 [Akkermansia sp.]|nr:hypothetical protein [Akkermansia sp.]